MTSRKIAVVAGAMVLAVAAAGQRPQASSHREALSILNEPCADNTDTFAWVSNGTHDKLYLVMDFNPLHEPGQGNQGLRACDGYRYEFHIGKGASLADRVVYRVEFKKRLTPEAAQSEGDPLGGGNELLWQLTGGTETMRVTRIAEGGKHDDDDNEVLGRNLPVLPNNHGPQTDRLIYGLGPFKGYDSGDATSRELGLYNQDFVDGFIHTLSNGSADYRRTVRRSVPARREGHLRPRQPGEAPTSEASPARVVRPPRTSSRDSTCSRSRSRCQFADIFPRGIPHNGQLKPDSTDSLLRMWSSISRHAAQIVDPNNIITGAPGLRPVRAGRAQCAAAVQRRARRNAAAVRCTCTATRATTSPTSAPTSCYPVLVRDAEALGIYKALGVPACDRSNAQGPACRHHQRHQPGQADPDRRRLHR